MALSLDETRQLLAILAVDQPSLQATPGTIAVWCDELHDHWITYELAAEAARLFRRRPEPEILKFRFLDIATFRHYLRQARDRAEARRRAEAAKRALPPGKRNDDESFRLRYPEEFLAKVHDGQARAAANHAFAEARRAGADYDEARAIGQKMYDRKMQELRSPELATTGENTNGND